MNNPDDISNTPKIPLELLNKLNSSWRDILSELSKSMTDEMLQFIASADYGYKEDKCFSYLNEIVTTQETPNQIEFILSECLELTRWIEPSNKKEHICRAFSCSLLLILENKSNYTPISDENETLAALIESITILKIAQYSTQDLIVWRILSDYNKERELYLADEEDKYYVDEITLNPFFIYSLLRKRSKS